MAWIVTGLIVAGIAIGIATSWTSIRRIWKALTHIGDAVSAVHVDATDPELQSTHRLSRREALAVRRRIEAERFDRKVHRLEQASRRWSEPDDPLTRYDETTTAFKENSHA